MFQEVNQLLAGPQGQVSGLWWQVESWKGPETTHSDRYQRCYPSSSQKPEGLLTGRKSSFWGAQGSAGAWAVALAWNQFSFMKLNLLILRESLWLQLGGQQRLRNMWTSTDASGISVMEDHLHNFTSPYPYTNHTCHKGITENKWNRHKTLPPTELSNQKKE